MKLSVSHEIYVQLYEFVASLVKLLKGTNLCITISQCSGNLAYIGDDACGIVITVVVLSLSLLSSDCCGLRWDGRCWLSFGLVCVVV